MSESNPVFNTQEFPKLSKLPDSSKTPELSKQEESQKPQEPKKAQNPKKSKKQKNSKKCKSTIFLCGVSVFLTGIFSGLIIYDANSRVKSREYAVTQIESANEYVSRAASTVQDIKEQVNDAELKLQNIMNVADQVENYSGISLDIQSEADVLIEQISNLSSESQAKFQNITDLSTYSENLVTVINFVMDRFENTCSTSSLDSKITSKVKDVASKAGFANDQISYVYKSLIDSKDQIVAQIDELSEMESNAQIALNSLTELEAQSLNEAENSDEVDEDSQERSLDVEDEIASESGANNDSADDQSADKGSSPSVLTPEGGVNYFNGIRETWYSENVVPEVTSEIPGRHADEDGLIRDEDNYICIGSHDYPIGTVVETSLGTGKVYDVMQDSNAINIYTNW